MVSVSLQNKGMVLNGGGFWAWPSFGPDLVRMPLGSGLCFTSVVIKHTAEKREIAEMGVVGCFAGMGLAAIISLRAGSQSARADANKQCD